MSNVITDARTEVADALSAVPGIRVFSYIPQNMNAPVAIVSPSEPYVVPGQAFGEFQVNLKVRLYAKRGTNEVVSEALDGLIVNVCNALRGHGVVNVSQPGVDSESYDDAYLVTDITISTYFKEAN